jgi:steroid delta-isomerase-like uncharacterized protein
MSTEDIINSQLDAFNRRDAAAFAGCYAAQAEVADPQFEEPLKGTEAIAKDIGAWFEAFPDIEAKVVRTVVNGTSYAAEWAMNGTHKGPLVMPDGHVPATGKPVHIAVATVGRLDGQGRVAEERRYYDLAGVMSQLGLIQ